MKVLEDVAREAGRALGDCGAGAGSRYVAEVAVVLAELAREPRRRAAARRKFEARNPEPETNSTRQ